MFFPISGIEISPFIPPLVAFLISSFTTMGGVSGAFLILPFQVSVLGYSSPSVSATNYVYNIVAIPGGVYRYIKEGRMLWSLACIIILGSLPGIFIGAIVRIKFLPNPRNFKLFVGLILMYIGGRLISDLLKKKRTHLEKSPDDVQLQQVSRNEYSSIAKFKKNSVDLAKVKTKVFKLNKIEYEFLGSEFKVNPLAILTLSFVVGIAGGIYGIGGGAIIAPVIISFFRLPVYTVAGATLAATFVSSIAGVGVYQLLAFYYPSMPLTPDWLLGLLFGIGGFAGTYCGARLQKFFPSRIIKGILVFCIVVIAFRYISGFMSN